jgi:hypothetical protein
MRTRKRLARKSPILVLVAIGSGLLIGIVPSRGDDAEPSKRPRALLHVAAHAPSGLFTTREKSEDYNRHLQTQFATTKSHLVLNTAIQQPAIARLAASSKQPDPIAWLAQNLEASNVNNSEVVQISFSPRSGASGTDQSAIINAVVSAYLQEVVGVEQKQRADRHSKLKRIKQQYADLLKERRDHARKLSESLGSGGPLADVEEQTLVRRYTTLLDQRLKLRLDHAAAETVLGRRQKAANRETDPVRKEIAQLEDRLAVLTAQDKVFQDELSQVAGKKRSAVEASLVLMELNDEIAQLENAARKVGAEVETLNIELGAPPRVRIIDNAVPPKQ